MVVREHFQPSGVDGLAIVVTLDVNRDLDDIVGRCSRLGKGGLEVLEALETLRLYRFGELAGLHALAHDAGRVDDVTHPRRHRNRRVGVFSLQVLVVENHVVGQPLHSVPRVVPGRFPA